MASWSYKQRYFTNRKKKYIYNRKRCSGNNILIPTYRPPSQSYKNPHRLLAEISPVFVQMFYLTPFWPKTQSGAVRMRKHKAGSVNPVAFKGVKQRMLWERAALSLCLMFWGLLGIGS